ncbi:unnamed protein product [Prorocentrum cordatum]|uniref:Uncharacterized protein n=1 Tax=Prorocentrum cordatum TaxID=2364126 RepID=A0ABN9X6C9_9DINO|nr:unnamed protein product [Polarella glacialis]
MCAVADTWTKAVTHPLLTHISDELEGSRKRVHGFKSELNKEALQRLGPPTPALVLAMLEGLVTCEVGGRVEQHITDYFEECQPADEAKDPTIDVEALMDQVPFIRIEKTHDPNVASLAMGAHDSPARKFVIDGLRAEGEARHHVGPAPVGWMEEEISVWLEHVKQIGA